MKNKAIRKVKNPNTGAIEQSSIYRTSPYQFVYTATLNNKIQTIGKLLKITNQVITIKPISVSTKTEK